MSGRNHRQNDFRPKPSIVGPQEVQQVLALAEENKRLRKEKEVLAVKLESFRRTMWLMIEKSPEGIIALDKKKAMEVNTAAFDGNSIRFKVDAESSETEIFFRLLTDEEASPQVVAPEPPPDSPAPE